MNISVTTTENTPEFKVFIENVIPRYIYKLYMSRVNLKRFIKIDKDYNINSNLVLEKAIKTLRVTRTNNRMYNISVNKNLRVYGKPIMSYINLITYGNITHKGYPILRDIMKFTAENIDKIYRRCSHGDSIL